MPSRLGALAGRYLLTRLLGEDAAVATFEGLDEAQDRPVLIKLLPKALAADPVRQEQLRRLVERLTALDHPNLLSVVETGLEEGVPYLIAEGIAATSLAEKMGQALDVEQVADVISQVGEALVYAEQQGLFHGNLSPQSVLLAASDRVLLADVGLESVLETPWEKGQEAMSAYLAPERVRGWLPDARTDVYALGVMLFEMLTGLRPDGPAAQALPWLREIAPDLATDLEPALTRALTPDPQRRYATVGEFMADLQPILARHLRPKEVTRPTAPTPLPAPASPQAPAPQPLPPPTLIVPALEGIPAIPMPEPPPMPSFDWAAFSRTMARVSMPEPLPMPEITAAGIEWPAVSSYTFEQPDRVAGDEKPEAAPPTGSPVTPPSSPPAPRERQASVPARLPAQPVRRIRQPAAARPAQPTPPPVQPAPRPQPSSGPRLLAGQSMKRIALLLIVLLFLAWACCCWFVIAGDWSSSRSTPTFDDSSLNDVGPVSWLPLEKGRLPDGTVHLG